MITIDEQGDYACHFDALRLKFNGRVTSRFQLSRDILAHTPLFFIADTRTSGDIESCLFLC